MKDKKPQTYTVRTKEWSCTTGHVHACMVKLSNFVTKFCPSKQPRLMKARHTRETDRCFFRNSLFEKQSVYTATYDEASIISGEGWGGVGMGLGMGLGTGLGMGLGTTLLLSMLQVLSYLSTWCNQRRKSTRQVSPTAIQAQQSPLGSAINFPWSQNTLVESLLWCHNRHQSQDLWRTVASHLSLMLEQGKIA